MARRRKPARRAPHPAVRMDWEERHRDLFIAFDSWAPPAQIVATVVRSTRIATYRAAFKDEHGRTVVARTRVKLLEKGGAEILEKTFSIRLAGRLKADAQ